MFAKFEKRLAVKRHPILDREDVVRLLKPCSEFEYAGVALDPTREDLKLCMWLLLEESAALTAIELFWLRKRIGLAMGRITWNEQLNLDFPGDCPKT